MDSIAEIITPDITLYWHFNDQDQKEVAQIQKELGELADQGMVYGLNFYTEQ
jgi:hypothetical protein